MGIYEEASGKATHGEEQAEEAFAASEEKRYDSTVVVRRLGDGQAPVEIEVHFEDETKVREQWDGSQPALAALGADSMAASASVSTLVNRIIEDFRIVLSPRIGSRCPSHQATR